MEINQILNDLTVKGTVYNDIILTNLGPHKHLEGALISELALIILEQQEKVLKSVNEGWFKYWLVKVIQNQIKSSTSPFHKNVRETIHTKLKGETIEVDYVEIEDEDDLTDKLIIEEQLNLIEECREELKVNFFDAEVFKLYYDEGLSYREIERNFDIDHCLAWNSVKKTRTKLKKLIDSRKKH